MSERGNQGLPIYFTLVFSIPRPKENADMDTFTTARLRAERLCPKHMKELLAMHKEAKVMNTLGY